MLTIVPRHADINSVDLVEPRTSIGTHDSNAVVIPSTSASEFHAEFHVNNNEVYLIDLDSESGTFINGEKVSCRIQVQHNDLVKMGDVEFTLIDPLQVNPAEEDPDATRVRAAFTTDDAKKTQVRVVVSADDAASDATVLNPVVPKAPDKQTQPENKKTTTEMNYQSISEGTTKTGETWQESEVKDENKTVLMPSMRDKAGRTGAAPNIKDKTSSARAMPIMEQEQEQVPELLCKSKPLAGKKFSLIKKVNSIGRTGGNDIEINESSVSSRHAEIINDNGTWVIRDLASYNGIFVNRKRCEKKTLKNGDVINIGRIPLVFSCKANKNFANSIKKLLAVMPLPMLPGILIIAVIMLVTILVLTYIY